MPIFAPNLPINATVTKQVVMSLGDTFTELPIELGQFTSDNKLVISTDARDFIGQWKIKIVYNIHYMHESTFSSPEFKLNIPDNTDSIAPKFADEQLEDIELTAG